MDYTSGLIKETEFFTTSELAKKLKMNVQVITRKVQSGEIRAYKIGKEWRIPEESIFAWLERNSNMRTEGKDHDEVTVPVGNEPSEKLPTQQSRRKYLLEYILAQFEPERLYDEEEVNRTIHRYNEEIDTVRGEFLTEKMMDLVEGKYRRRSGYRFSD